MCRFLSYNHDMNGLYPSLAARLTPGQGSEVKVHLLCSFLVMDGRLNVFPENKLVRLMSDVTTPDSWVHSKIQTTDTPLRSTAPPPPPTPPTWCAQRRQVSDNDGMCVSAPPVREHPQRVLVRGCSGYCSLRRRSHDSLLIKTGFKVVVQRNFEDVDVGIAASARHGLQPPYVRTRRWDAMALWQH